MNTTPSPENNDQFAQDVRAHCEKLANIPHDDFANEPDQLKVFEWFIVMQNILGEKLLSGELKNEVVRAIQKSGVVYEEEKKDPGTLISNYVRNGNFYIFDTLRKIGGIPASQVHFYKQKLNAPQNAGILQMETYKNLRDLINPRN